MYTSTSPVVAGMMKGGEGDEEPKVTNAPPRARTEDDDTADIRDIIANFVAARRVGITDHDSKSQFMRLSQLVGQDKAQKLITAISIHNQTQPTQNMTPEQRLNSFYSTIQNDKDIEPIIKKTKGFSYGYIPGFNSSVNASNQVITGRLKFEDQAVKPKVMALFNNPSLMPVM